jgi:hypothetical protein
VLATLLNLDPAEKMKGVKILGSLSKPARYSFSASPSRPIWCNPSASRRIVCTEAAIMAPNAPSLASPQPVNAIAADGRDKHFRYFNGLERPAPDFD